MIKFAVKSDDVLDDVLEAIGLEKDKDDLLQSVTITLELGKPVIVEQTKMVEKKDV